MYGFAKEMNFDVNAMGNKSTRGRTLIKLLELPSVMVYASGNSMKLFSKVLFLPENPDDLWNRLKLLLQELPAGNNLDIINEEIVAILVKLLEHKYISKKQHKQMFFQCSLLHE